MNGNGSDAAGQVAVRIGQRLHGRERLAHREWLIVGGGVPLVAGDAAVEDAGGRAHGHPAVAPRIPGDPQARRDVVGVGLDDASADPGIAWEQQADRRGRRHLRLHAGNEGELAVVGIGERELQVVADAKVEGEPGMDAEVVLRERADVGAIVGLPHRGVLRHGGGKPEQEVGVGVAGLAAVEGEDAVVVEQRVVNDLLVRDLAAELEGVVAAAHAQRVLHREVVAPGIGTGDGDLAGEVTGHGEARERRVALDRELRVEIAERRRGVIHAAAELPHVADAELVDHRRAQRPRVGDVEVVLLPLEVAIDPRDVARPRERLRIGAGQEEVAHGDAVRLGEVVIQLEGRLVGLERIGRPHLEEVVGQIRRSARTCPGSSAPPRRCARQE